MTDTNGLAEPLAASLLITATSVVTISSLLVAV